MRLSTASSPDRARRCRRPANRLGCLVAVSALSLAVEDPRPARAQADTVVDVELVLAVDASSSVDTVEYALQIGGIAAAFRNQTVIDAIVGGIHRRIAVAMVVWSDAKAAKDVTPWRIIGSAADAHAFAAFLEARPRYIGGGGTGIGSGVAAAIRHLEANDIQGRRMVVDVSGDGKENSVGVVPPQSMVLQPAVRESVAARKAAEEQGITINGLAILNEEPELVAWYDRYVRSGPQSFVMAADDYEDFARAIRAKLLREIGTNPTAINRAGAVPKS